MPLDTSIARSVRPLKIQFRDLGADYNQLAQMQSAESQNQLAQMQMQESRQLAPLRLQAQQSQATVAKMALDEVNEAQTYVRAVMTEAANKSGGTAPKDPFAAAKQMIDHPNAQVQAAGLRLLESSQKLQDYKAEADYQTFRGQPVAGAPAAAAPGAVNATPVVPTTSPAAGKAIKPIATGVFVDSTVSPENIRQLEKLGDQATFFDPTSYWTQNSDGKLVVGRSGTPVAAAPAAVAEAPAQPDMANALALKIQGLEAQQNQLEPFLKSASAKAKYDKLGKQIENLSKGFSVPAGGAYFQPGVGMVARDAAAPALTDVSRFIAERNAAVARNAPPDEIAALNAAIKKATTSTPPISVENKINTYMPASEEAQRDFIRSTRATYDTLKNAPGTLKNIEEAIKLIPNAKGFMGPGGESLLDAASFLNNRLGTNINTKGVTNATELRSRLFQGIIENLRKLDANPTENQQNAMRVALGNIGTDPNALPAVLNSFADTVRSKVDMHNAEVEGAVSRGVKFPYDPTIKLPTFTPPAPPKATARPAGVPAEWTLQVDGAGKKAYVSPDGKSFKEVP
jgi:hypothetical protein